MILGGGGLSRLDLLHRIGKEHALALVSIFKEKDQMKSVGLTGCNLGVDGAKAVADYVSLSGSLTKLDVRQHPEPLDARGRMACITRDGEKQLVAAVLESKSMEEFSKIPMRRNSYTVQHSAHVHITFTY